MIGFKGCPKCHGDLYLNKDMYGKYISCLQCGYMKDLPPESMELKESAVESREPVTAGTSELSKAA